MGFSCLCCPTLIFAHIWKQPLCQDWFSLLFLEGGLEGGEPRL